jgi:hypothetical protein
MTVMKVALASTALSLNRPHVCGAAVKRGSAQLANLVNGYVAALIVCSLCFLLNFYFCCFVFRELEEEDEEPAPRKRGRRKKKKKLVKSAKNVDAVDDDIDSNSAQSSLNCSQQRKTFVIYCDRVDSFFFVGSNQVIS